MSNLALYLISVLVWGSTWFAIEFQLGLVEPERLLSDLLFPLVTLLVSLLVVQSGGLQIFFMSIPAWGLALVLYVASSAFLQRRAGAEVEA